MRRKVTNRKEAKPDIIHGSVKLQKFINSIMWDGKKEASRKIVYGALDIIKEKLDTDPVIVFEEAIRNAGPSVEVRSRRIGGANYQVPREVRPERKQALAIRWIVAAARGKKGVPMAEKIAEELMLAAKNEGIAVKKRDDTHKMAESNKAFAHFAW